MTKGEIMFYGGMACVGGFFLLLVIILMTAGKKRNKMIEKIQKELHTAKVLALFCVVMLVPLAGCLRERDGGSNLPEKQKRLEEIAEPISFDLREGMETVQGWEEADQKPETAGESMASEQEPETAGESNEPGQKPEAGAESNEPGQEPETAGESNESGQEPETAGESNGSGQEPEVFMENAWADGRIDSLNQVELKPQMPQSENLKEVLNAIMPEITAGCTTTYDQVKACYDYLINTCDFSNTVKYSYEQDAYIFLTEKHGSCTYYAAAFHYMLLYIGIDNKIIDGYRYPMPEISKKSSFHRWNEITVDGVAYILDSQWEDTLSHGEEIMYERFMKTHEELAEYYVF